MRTVNQVTETSESEDFVYEEVQLLCMVWDNLEDSPFLKEVKWESVQTHCHIIAERSKSYDPFGLITVTIVFRVLI